MSNQEISPEEWVKSSLREIRGQWDTGEPNAFTAFVDWFVQTDKDPSEALMHTLMYFNLAVRGFDFVTLTPLQAYYITAYKQGVRGKKFNSNTLRHVYLPVNESTENLTAPTFLKTEAPQFVKWLDERNFFSDMVNAGFMDDQLAQDVKNLVYLTKMNQLSIKWFQDTLNMVKQTEKSAYIGLWSENPGKQYLVDKGVAMYSIPAGPLFYFFNTVYENGLFLGGMSKKSFQQAVDSVRSRPEEQKERPELLIKPTEKILEWLLADHGEKPGAFYDEVQGLVLEIRP